MIGRWVAEQIGRPFYQPVATLGWLDASGSLAGGCAFHNYEGANIDLAIATARPVVRGIIRAICHYVFIQLRCERVTVRVRKSNKNALKSAAKLGFKYECSLERWFGSENGVQLKLMREHCKWI
jgi:RimJ/RimL family protein N-acetyltransferase